MTHSVAQSYQCISHVGKYKRLCYYSNGKYLIIIYKIRLTANSQILRYLP